MKTNLHWKTVICFILLSFCVGYLITRLIIIGKWMDVLAGVAIVVLFPLLVHYIRKGE